MLGPYKYSYPKGEVKPKPYFKKGKNKRTKKKEKFK